MPVLDWLQGMMGGTPQKYGTLVPGGALAVPPEPPGVLDRLGAMLTTPAWDQVQQSDEQTRALIDQGRYADATRQGLDNPMLGAFGGNIKRAYQGPPIRAYHGSPHQFDPEPGAPYGRFRNDRIGEGEGAQAYGYGMPYLAEAESVGKNYRDALSAQRATLNGRLVSDLAAEKYRMGIKEAPSDIHNIADYVSSYQNNARYMMEKRSPELVPVYDKLVAEGGLKQGGHMYEVDIHADPNRFLDWDKRLAQQPDMAALLQKKRIPGFDPDITGRELYGRASEVFGGEAGASRVLQKSGVAGTRYLDERSRGPDLAATRKSLDYARGIIAQGKLKPADIPSWEAHVASLERDLIAAQKPRTSNYAMFDPKLVEILRRYGILGPTAATGLLGASADE